MFELELRAPEDAVEAVCDALLEQGALSVSVEDADADTPAEQALFGEPNMPSPKAGWRRSTLRALFADRGEATAAAGVLIQRDGGDRLSLGSIEQIPEQDWVRLTQSQFAPVEITPSFWIVPTWHEAPAAAREVIRLDPGLAFGTGTHPTTRMCLRWIASHADAVRDRAVLDYGCGSGILAIGAARFGASGLCAVDIDPAAVRSTLDNAKANGVSLRAGEPALAGEPAGRYELVLANILATPLKLLAPLLAAHVTPGGHLVLAGILERQATELQAAYAPILALQVVDQEDGWILMTAQRDA